MRRCLSVGRREKIERNVHHPWHPPTDRTPAHCCSKEGDRRSRHGSTAAQRRKGHHGVPSTKHRLPMFLRASPKTGRGSEAEENNLSRGTAFSDVPMIPANDLRGRLRRCAARQVFDVLLSKDEQISLDAYPGMTCGAVTGSPCWQTDLRRGGTGDAASLPWPVRRRTENGALLPRRIDDAIQFTDGHAQTVVRDFGSEVTRWIESVSAVKKARATTDNQSV